MVTEINQESRLSAALTFLSSIMLLYLRKLLYCFWYGSTSGSCYLANLEPKHLLEVCWLADEKQVKSPASAEISHDDGIHWHGCKEAPPWCVEFL